MSHPFHKFAELFPKFDCGLCGYPTCRGLARRIVAGRSEVKSCPHLIRPAFEAHLKELTEMMRVGVDLAKTANLDEARIVYVRPCISEAGKVTASTRLTLSPTLQPTPYGLFDTETFCKTLELAQLIGEVRCSPSLGTARIIQASRTLLVSKDGILNLRGAQDKDEAISTIRALSRILWGAAVCPACGNVGFDCSSGGCTECFSVPCPLIKNGPPNMLEQHSSAESQTTVRDALRRQNIGAQWGQLKEILRNLDKVADRIARAAEGKPEEYPHNAIRLELDGAMRPAVALIAETTSLRDAILGFVFMGLSLDLSRIADALNELSAMKQASETTEFAQKATGIALRGYELLKMPNGADLRLGEDYHTLRETLNKAHMRAPDDRSFIWALKVAANAFYICRLPDLRLPG